MISYSDGVFYLSTSSTSYWFCVTKFNHLEHIYYGKKLTLQNPDALKIKRTAATGSSVVYDKTDELYCLDTIPLEWSGIGKGDFRYSPSELRMPDGSFVCDFTYERHEIINGAMPMDTLPNAYGGDAVTTLLIYMRDTSNDVELRLYYTVYSECDVIARRAVLINNNSEQLEIRRLLSMMVDLPNDNYDLVTFDGGWIKETNTHIRPLAPGMYVNSSTTGSSSNRHSPGFLISERGANSEAGAVYGFNLVYSGNHFGFAELGGYELLRVGIGINPHCFSYTLNRGCVFETPEAVMSYSGHGFNGLSNNFHSFVNAHIVRGDWKDKERPVLFNNWEATFFKYNERKLIRLARRAKKLGVELFVLDDGWFGERNSDNAGLGDYDVNKKKFRHGLPRFARRLRRMGLLFGLWFEPEMVNEDSGLYRSHPEYAIKLPGRTPSLGRNQLVLDLCQKAVRDYIVENVCNVLDETGAVYVKWDMNRHISDMYSTATENQGEFFHKYIVGLYDILERVFSSHPHILFESCASGGGRFDLGMLCYSQQVWASDNTDPMARLDIQGGLTHLYPLSTIGAHVSLSPHQQTLRSTPLSTRFNAAAFGCLGYELDLNHLNFLERREVKDQIEFYKRYRRLFQFGRFFTVKNNRQNQILWQCVGENGESAVCALFQTMAQTASGHSRLIFNHINEGMRYNVTTKPQRLFIKRFGGLIKHVLPVPLDPDGFILRFLNRVYALNDCVESYECDGAMLKQGIYLNNQFMGSYYNENTELLGDFGSYMFICENSNEKAV